MFQKTIGGVADPTRIQYDFCSPGSFDPWTKGHRSVIIQALEKYPDKKIVIAIAVNPTKTGMFSYEDRRHIIEQSFSPEHRVRIKVVIIESDQAVANYMYGRGIKAFVKGWRNKADLEYEKNLAAINKELFGNPETVLLEQNDEAMNTVSSSNVKMMANLGISLEKYVPAAVRESLKMKTSGRMFCGVAGGIASGKSTFIGKLLDYAKQMGFPMYHRSMDEITRVIYSETKNEDFLEMCIQTREKIAAEFGQGVLNADGTIDTKNLGKVIYQDEDVKKIKERLDKLTNIMVEPNLFIMSQQIRKMGPGFYLDENAILVERGLTELVDQNIILVKVKSPDIQIDRMVNKRGLTGEAAQRRLHTQLTVEETQKIIKNNQHGDRLYIEVETTEDYSIPDIFAQIEKKYYFGFNVRRYENIFIPGEVAFRDERACVDMLTKQYDAVGRHEHRSTHLSEMLVAYQSVKHLLKNPVEVYLSILFHDYVYDVTQRNNEASSVACALEYLADNLVSPATIDLNLVQNLIMLSAQHGQKALTKMTLTDDQKLFLDLDKIALGAHPGRFAGYCEGIAQEYMPHFPEIYYPKRLEFLQKLLKQPIYMSEHFTKKLGAVARLNIEGEIARLEAILKENK